MPEITTNQAEPHPLLVALSNQKRVISALFLREIMTRYGRHNIGFFWLFLEPMMFTLIIGLVWYFIRGRDDRFGIPIFAFALTGYSAVLLWRNMPSQCLGAAKANTALLFHRLVRPLDIYLARITLEAAGGTMSFFVLSAAFIWIGMISFPYDLLLVVVGWAMLVWFGLSLAIFLAPLSEKYELVGRIWRPVSYVLFPLSGAIFMVSSLPERGQKFILLLPMVHGVECIRDGFFGDRVETIYNLGYMALCNSILMLLGLALERKMSRNIQVS